MKLERETEKMIQCASRVIGIMSADDAEGTMSADDIRLSVALLQVEIENVLMKYGITAEQMISTAISAELVKQSMAIGA